MMTEKPVYWRMNMQEERTESVSDFSEPEETFRGSEEEVERRLGYYLLVTEYGPVEVRKGMSQIPIRGRHIVHLTGSTGEKTIGRSTANDVVLSDKQISRQHAKVIWNKEGEYTILDLESKNGMWIYGFAGIPEFQRSAVPLPLNEPGVSFGESEVGRMGVASVVVFHNPPITLFDPPSVSVNSETK